MQLRALLHKRLHVHIALRDPELPSVHAAADTAGDPHGFVASFGIGNLIAVLGMAAGLISGYADLRSTATENARRIDSLNARVVSRTEIEAAVKDLNTRIDTLQAGQTQVVGHLLAEKH